MTKLTRPEESALHNKQVLEFGEASVELAELLTADIPQEVVESALDKAKELSEMPWFSPARAYLQIISQLKYRLVLMKLEEH